MLSKLIVHADTREECIEAMLRAIDNYEVIGVKTTLILDGLPSITRHSVQVTLTQVS